MRDSSRVRKAITHNVVYRLLSQAATAVTYIFLVRMFSEAEFGIYHLFYAIPPVIAAVFSFGITNTLSRFLPEYLHSSKFSFAKSLLSWSMRVRIFSSVLVLTIAIIYWDPFSSLFKISEYKTYFILFAFIVVTHLQCRLLTISLSAYLLQQWSMGLTAAFIVAKLLGYLIVTGVAGFSLWSALAVDLVANVLWYIALCWSNKTFIPRGASAESFSPTERRRLLRYAVFHNFNDVGSLTLNSRTDNLFIAAFMNPVHVGAYAFCTQLESFSQRILPTRFFGTIIRPLIFRLNYKTQANRARQYFQFLIRLNYLFIFPIFVFVAAVPDALIMIVFGGKFVEYSQVLVATFAFSCISGFHQPVTIIAQLAERAGIILASKIFAIYNVVANIALIPLYGIMGAVIATGSAMFFKNIFIWAFVRDVASFRGTGRFFGSQIILWSVCWYCLHLITNYTTDLMSLLSAIPIMTLSTVIAWRLTDFSARDRDLLKKLGGPRAQRVLHLVGITR